jgi:hypothetical protein
MLFVLEQIAAAMKTCDEWWEKIHALTCDEWWEKIQQSVDLIFAKVEAHDEAHQQISA